MPDMGTIATTLTVNAAPAQAGFNAFNRGLASVDVQAKQLARSAGRGSGGAAFALLELGRGAEDAAVGFGTNGLQGAIRGSLNNLTTFATLVGGPLAGAIAGVTAAGVSMLSTFFKPAEDQTKKLEDATRKYREELERLKGVADARLEIQGLVAGPRGGIEDDILFGRDRGKIEEAIKKREQERAQLRDQREILGRRAQDIAFKIPVAEGAEKTTLKGQLIATDAEIEKAHKREAAIIGELAELKRANAEELHREDLARGKEMQDQVRQWRDEIAGQDAARERQAMEERKRKFFAEGFGKEFEANGLRMLGAVPSVGAAVKGSSAAGSAIARATNNNGVEQKQLTELKEMKKGIEKIARNLPIPIIVGF